MDQLDSTRHAELGEDCAYLVPGGSGRRAAPVSDLRLGPALDEHPRHCLFGLRQLVWEVHIGSRKAAQLQLLPLVNADCDAGPNCHVERWTAVKGNSRHDHEQRELAWSALQPKTVNAAPNSQGD